MARRRVRLLGVVGSIALGAAGDAWAAEPSEARCVAAKARIVASVIERVAACHAKNVLAGGTVGPDCFTRAGLPLLRLDRADRFGPCGGDHAYLGELARSSCVRVPQVFFDRCNAGKIRAAGDLAAGLVRCLGKSGGTLDPECFARKRAQFLADFERAERRGPCPVTADYFSEGVDQCMDDIVIALSCGNGRIDRGEECDGQIFCTVRECRVVTEISCCQIGADFCVDAFPEMCFAAGLQIAPGFCGGTPVPELCSTCKHGGCEDPPIPATSVCCEMVTSCQATTVATTVGLMNELHECRVGGGQPFIGTCGPDAACLP
jgi:hypothetical protein